MVKRSVISIVVPAYNEEDGIEYFHKTLLLPVLKKLNYDHEIVYVNDGSQDRTIDKLNNLSRGDNSVKVVNLSRNFGKEAATSAGIHHASGEAIVIMDADGQHPPAVLQQFIDKWKSGNQVVVGVRKEQHHETLIKKWGSKIFYKAFNVSTGEKLVPRSTDYRLITKEVQAEFKKLSENERITRGLIDWLGFDRDYVEFDSPERELGQSSYKTGALIRLAVNSFVSLSLKPLFIFGYIGAFITFVALVIGVFIIIEQFILDDPLNLAFTGSAMLGIFISFLVGLVLLSQSILAVYISHIHKESKKRPLYIVNYKKSNNVNELK